MDDFGNCESPQIQEIQDQFHLFVWDDDCQLTSPSCLEGLDAAKWVRGHQSFVASEEMGMGQTVICQRNCDVVAVDSEFS